MVYWQVSVKKFFSIYLSFFSQIHHIPKKSHATMYSVIQFLADAYSLPLQFEQTEFV